MRDPDTPIEPLGFADLSDDEGLIIAIYRDWQSRTSAGLNGENDLVRALRHDPIYPALEPLFDVFAEVPQIAEDPGIGDMLSIAEEVLLSVLSAETNIQTDAAIRCRDALAIAEMVPRKQSEIPRSGHDRLHGLINAASRPMALAD